MISFNINVFDAIEYKQKLNEQQKYQPNMYFMNLHKELGSICSFATIGH